MLKAESLACRRGRHLVIRNVGFTLGAGSLLLVTGRNGSGKSSLLRVLAGLLPLFAGEMFWNGKQIEDFAVHRARVHYLGHRDALKPELTVAETIDYWHALFRARPVSDTTFLEPFGLAGSQATPVRYLSAGQKRRLALARLAMIEAPMWLLDEPSTALDGKGQGLLEQLVAKHRAGGGAAVIATHHDADFGDAQHLALDGAAA
jgi:heme exporter protein A